MRTTAYIDENDCTIEATGSEAAYLVKLECITNGIPLPRLEEICNAERDGRCAVLPCKAGDTVYWVENNEIKSGKAWQFGYEGYLWLTVSVSKRNVVVLRCDLLYFDRAEAEAKLHRGG